MAGFTFAVVDRETGDEFNLITVGQERAAAESRLFQLGFVLGGVREHAGWRVDEDLRRDKVGLIREFDRLRAAGNQRPELDESLSLWLPLSERAELLAWSSIQDWSDRNVVRLDNGVELTFNLSFSPTKTWDPGAGGMREMTPEESVELERLTAMSASSLSQPTGKVYEAVAGRSEADPAKPPTLAEMVGLANVECYPNQRYWLLAELVSRYARARKRDPASVQRAKHWAWQLLLEFPAPPAELDRHPKQYERFNPLNPLQTLVKLLREEGHNERADQVASFIPPIARRKR